LGKNRAKAACDFRRLKARTFRFGCAARGALVLRRAPGGKVEAKGDEENVCPIVSVRLRGIALCVGGSKIRVEEVVQEVLHFHTELSAEVETGKHCSSKLRSALAKPFVELPFEPAVAVGEELFLVVERQTHLSAEVEELPFLHVAQLDAQGEPEHVDTALETILLAEAVLGDEADISDVIAQKDTGTVDKVPVEVVAEVEHRRPAEDGAHFATVHFCGTQGEDAAVAAGGDVGDAALRGWGLLDLSEENGLEAQEQASGESEHF